MPNTLTYMLPQQTPKRFIINDEFYMTEISSSKMFINSFDFSKKTFNTLHPTVH